MAKKGLYKNHGINFFLYDLSGQKFRSDVVKVIRIYIKRPDESSNSSLSNVTNSTMQTISMDGQQLG